MESWSYPKTRRRYSIALLCLWITTICYSDRTNIGIAIPAFIHSKEEQGQILSAFFYGYMITQIPGGFFATKLGAKRVLIIGVVVWTLFDFSTIFVSSNFSLLFLARVGMGLGEGILFPCMHQLSSSWYPSQERSRLVSFVSSGGDLGTIIALAVSPVIMAYAGWKRVFELFAGLSFIWIVVYSIYGESDPVNDTRITSEERSFILANRSRVTGIETSHTIDWKRLLTSRPAWAVYVAHFCHNYGWYVLLGWIPQYFHQVLHIDLGKNGFAAAIPYLCGWVGVLLFGRLGDQWVKHGHSVLHVRQTINAIGFFGSAICLFSLQFISNVQVAVVMLSLTLFCGRAAIAGYWVNMIDIAPHQAAHVMAISNTFATIPGIIGNVITGHILAVTGNWDLVFAIASGVLVCGGIFFHFNASDQSIYNDIIEKYASPSHRLSCSITTVDDEDMEEHGLLRV